ncbi:MAG: OmpA family protein [Pirellulales bacterium]|nr:OmpA family protein [Pirellulales bacterium]
MRRFGRVPGLPLLALGSRTGSVCAWGLAVVLLIGVSGCSKNAMFTQDQVKKAQAQYATLNNQYEQARGRVATLDRDNQELQTLWAQSEAQNKLLKDQMAALQKQLGDTAEKLKIAQAGRAESDDRVEAMTASLKRRGSVTIEPNSSVQRSLPTISLPGIESRRDGQVIRIVLPADRLFQPGTAQLRPGADKLIAQVGNELLRVYPNQMIAAEGHTDSASPTGQFHSHHELSAAWALAVQQILATQTGLRPRQLLVTGHGANHPRYSNGPRGGQQYNRRVELVVYPDQVGS